MHLTSLIPETSSTSNVVVVESKIKTNVDGNNSDDDNSDDDNSDEESERGTMRMNITRQGRDENKQRVNTKSKNLTSLSQADMCASAPKPIYAHNIKWTVERASDDTAQLLFRSSTLSNTCTHSGDDQTRAREREWVRRERAKYIQHISFAYRRERPMVWEPICRFSEWKMRRWTHTMHRQKQQQQK